jgi:hypothetical protein
MSSVEWITYTIFFGLLLYGIAALARSYGKEPHDGKMVWVCVLLYVLMTSLATLVEHLQGV